MYPYIIFDMDNTLFDFNINPFKRQKLEDACVCIDLSAKSDITKTTLQPIAT